MNTPCAAPCPATLVLGGARSGKSRYAQAQAEARAEADGLAPIYVATAQAYDGEMEARIAAHVAARDARWRTIDAPYELGAALAAHAMPATMLLVDCLTLWLSNVMLRGDDVDAAVTALAAQACRLDGPAILVSNEVGSGIVPDNVLGRRFRDAQGWLNQKMAASCATVVLVTAGLPLTLKAPGWTPGG